MCTLLTVQRCMCWLEYTKNGFRLIVQCGQIIYLSLAILSKQYYFLCCIYRVIIMTAFRDLLFLRISSDREIIQFIFCIQMFSNNYKKLSQRPYRKMFFVVCRGFKLFQADVRLISLTKISMHFWPWLFHSDSLPQLSLMYSIPQEFEYVGKFEWEPTEYPNRLS